MQETRALHLSAFVLFSFFSTKSVYLVVASRSFMAVIPPAPPLSPHLRRGSQLTQRNVHDEETMFERLIYLLPVGKASHTDSDPRDGWLWIPPAGR